MQPSRDEASQLAHELNNLLAVIGGHADALEPAVPAEGPDHESIEAIQRAVRAAAGVAERVRRLGRQAPAPVRGVDVVPVIDAVAGDATRRFGHRLSVACHAMPHLWSVAVDPAVIEPVIQHLMARAADVMPHGGTLNVRAMNVELGAAAGQGSSRRQRHVRIELSGPTVVPEPGATSPSDRAVGEHESAVAALTHAGGRLTVEGDGATMATWAVLLPSDGIAPMHPALVVDRSASVLLLDADQARRGLVESLLQRQGFAARGAASVDEAARALDASPVDLLVADGALTGSGGDAAALARRHAVRVLRIETAGTAAADAAPATVLRAPFTAEQLIAGVDAALAAELVVASVPRVLAYRDVVVVHSEEIA